MTGEMFRDCLVGDCAPVFTAESVADLIVADCAAFDLVGVQSWCDHGEAVVRLALGPTGPYAWAHRDDVGRHLASRFEAGQTVVCMVPGAVGETWTGVVVGPAEVPQRQSWGDFPDPEVYRGRFIVRDCSSGVRYATDPARILRIAPMSQRVYETHCAIR